MKILSVSQIRDADAFTIKHEPIASLDLMERASLTFVHWLVEWADPLAGPVQVFCGPGNNGGDGLAVARLLHQRFFDVRLFLCEISPEPSPDFEANLKRIREPGIIPIQHIKKGQAFPEMAQTGLVIDAIFGSGLSRPVVGYWAELLEHLNQLPQTKVAIDVPSGLFADRPTKNEVSFHADRTLTFELPKLAFFLPENERRVGHWEVRSIQLHPEFLDTVNTDLFYLEEEDIVPFLKDRPIFGHKGVFGHALLIAGSYGKVGAALLAARAALRAGAGLVTIHAPKCAYQILQIGFPEAMVSVDPHEFVWSETQKLASYQSIGVGPGIGTNEVTQTALRELLQSADQPMVVDADALNCLAMHPGLLWHIPDGSILCPHPREFERLFGPSKNGFERLNLLRKKAQDLGLIIVLKGAYSCIALPNGTCYFNSTGNPGMGTGGSGDVLTGILTGLLAQNYTSVEAALLGVYLHGLAGDLAMGSLQQEALLASDIIEHLGAAYKVLRGVDNGQLKVES